MLEPRNKLDVEDPDDSQKLTKLILNFSVSIHMTSFAMFLPASKHRPKLSLAVPGLAPSGSQQYHVITL